MSAIDLKALSLSDRAFVALMEANWDATTAFKALFNTKAAPSSIPVLASRKRVALAEYIQSGEIVKPDTAESLEGGSIRNKDDIRSELNILIDAEKDSTRKAKLLLDLAALDGMKKTDGQEDAPVVSYFLPLRCINACSLYADAVARGDIEPS